MRRIADNHRATLAYDDTVVDLIAKRCAEVESGARVVDAILTNTVLPAISREVLNRTMEGKTIEQISIGAGEAGFSYDFVLTGNYCGSVKPGAVLGPASAGR